MPERDLSALLNNPQELQRTLQQTQTKLYDAIRTAYGDLENADKKSQESIANSETITNNILKTVETGANEITDSTNLAKRQTEINEWVNNNKRETLFVYQMLLIAISLSIIFTYMWAKLIMGNGLYFMLFILVWLIFAFVIVNRSQYTDKSRDKRYWNRRLFREEAGAKIPIPSCDSISSTAYEAAESIQDIYSKLSNK